MPVTVADAEAIMMDSAHPLAERLVPIMLRVPIEEAWLPCHDDTLGAAVQAVLDDLRLPLRDALKRRVGDIFPQTDERTGA